MNAADIIEALHLPAEARVDRRVPKKLLLEHGGRMGADKRRIQEGIEEIVWCAALKPTTVFVPEFRDAVREYLEIAVLTLVLRPDAQADRLAELVHRAVPYPVFLLVSLGERLSVSLAHKRWSQAEADATVLEGEPVVVDLSRERDNALMQAFADALSLTEQPRFHLYALYQGWMDTAFSLLAGRMTGVFTKAESPDRAMMRREALAECTRLQAQMARLRATALKETQIARQVELNLELKRVEAAFAAARARV